jgi:hypothetical protein
MTRNDKKSAKLFLMHALGKMLQKTCHFLSLKVFVICIRDNATERTAV